MLSYLTDAHISPKVTAQIATKRPEIAVHALRVWRDGALLEADEAIILEADRSEGLTLVTYDQRAIVPLVMQWMEEGRNYTGVLLIDERSILQEDIGTQVRALIALWDTAHTEDWTNVVAYLKPPS